MLFSLIRMMLPYSALSKHAIAFKHVLKCDSVVIAGRESKLKRRFNFKNDKISATYDCLRHFDYYSRATWPMMFILTGVMLRLLKKRFTCVQLHLFSPIFGFKEFNILEHSGWIGKLDKSLLLQVWCKCPFKLLFRNAYSWCNFSTTNIFIETNKLPK